MTLRETESDEELWKRFKENHDQQAFCLLIKPYRERVLAYLIRLTGDAEESLDLMQETLRRFSRYYDGTRSSVKTFLFHIAINLARSNYRRSKARVLLSLDMLQEDGLEVAQSRDYYQDELRVSLVHQALHELPVRDREAIELKDVEGFTYQSAANIIGCSVKRFEKRLLQARKRLKRILTQSKDYEQLVENEWFP